MNLSYVVVKAVRVIRSCETLEQLKVAEKYCERVKQLVPEKGRGFLPTFSCLLKNKQKSLEDKQMVNNIEDLSKTVVNYERR